MKNKKVIIITLSLITALSIIYIFRYPISDVVTDVIAEYFIPKSNIKKEYLLCDGYVTRVYGTTTPLYYERVNDENVDSIFQKNELLSHINTMDDFENKLSETGIVEVKTEGNKRESFKNYSFSEETEDLFVICDVIKSENGEYYVNMWGGKYVNGEKIYVDYYIETQRPENP